MEENRGEEEIMRQSDASASLQLLLQNISEGKEI